MFPWILFGFALPAVFWCGMPIHRKAFRNLRGGVPTMELLFSIGIFSALLTVESRPVAKKEGSKVLASAMNVNGHIEVRVDACGRDTVLFSIIRLVEQALASKSDLERMVDKVSRVFIPGVLVVSLVPAS